MVDAYIASSYWSEDLVFTSGGILRIENKALILPSPPSTILLR
jgi:hypothetical protein